MGRVRDRFWHRTILVVAAVAAAMAFTVRQGVAGPVRWVEATEARLIGNGNSTTFELTMSDGLPAQAFTLANPYRVIIDFPDLAFRLPPGTGQKGYGLVKAFRFGLFAKHKSRIVIDTNGPVKIASAHMTRLGRGSAVKLAMVLQPIDAAAFGAGTGADRPPEAAARSKNPREKADTKRQPGSKPVIVIDAGHGGVDPGAIGVNNVAEKTIVLAVAKELRAVLNRTGAYVVKMTRTDDVFVSLDGRLQFSDDNDADLFISLHADSIEGKKVAQTVRGATIYTLSDRASDEEARVKAEEENASDLIAGLAPAKHDRSDQVKNILFDLMKRETANFSADFSQTLVQRLKRVTEMSRIPQRSAAFKVLKQTHAPSVLVELGYISNKSDENEMTTKSWREKVAAAIASAVQIYFRRRTPERP